MVFRYCDVAETVASTLGETPSYVMLHVGLNGVTTNKILKKLPKVL